METETVNLPMVQSVKYLGSTIDRRGGASKDVESRVAKAWSKWRDLTGVISDKKVPTKMKLRLICQRAIRPALLYGCKTWPMSVKDEKHMATTEMRIVPCSSSTMRFIHINEYEYINNYAQYIILHTRIRIQ